MVFTLSFLVPNGFFDGHRPGSDDGFAWSAHQCMVPGRHTWPGGCLFDGAVSFLYFFPERNNQENKKKTITDGTIQKTTAN